MDPPSPIMRDLSTKQILEDLINDGAVPDDGEADGSGDGEADGSGDEEANGSDDGEAGEVNIYEVRRI